MGVVIDADVWEPSRSIYLFILVSCLVLTVTLPYFSNRTPTIFDQSLPPSVLRFRRRFLLVFALSSVMEGLASVTGEYELASGEISREQMLLCLSAGVAALLLLGTFLGWLGDVIGQQKVCLIFCILHLFVGVWKRFISHPSIWLASICLSLASSIYSFAFETWIVVEHDKLGHRSDTLNDMFWLITFSESASFIGSQALANLLVDSSAKKHFLLPLNAVLLLAIVSLICVTWGWRESPPAALKDYWISFYFQVVCEKRILLLAWTQSCVQFSIAVFWILWAPTIVADGREVHLGLIYPCLLGARMLGSTTFPWFTSGPLLLRSENYLVILFVVAGLVLSIVAFDYQEVGVLVALFCLFQACIGLILPSLARLRTVCVPNELRAGMISFSSAPANAVILIFLLQRSHYWSLENSTLIAVAALGLFSAASCMHFLKKMGKLLPRQNFHIM